MEKYPAIMNIAQAAEYLQLRVSTVRQLAWEGEIPASKVGKEWRFLRSTLDHWLLAKEDTILEPSTKQTNSFAALSFGASILIAFLLFFIDTPLAILGALIKLITGQYPNWAKYKLARGVAMALHRWSEKNSIYR